MEWKTKPKFQANDPVVHKQTRQRGFIQDVTMLSEYAVLANLLKGRQQVLVKWHHQEEPTMERIMDLEHKLEHEMPKRSLSAPAQRPCIRVPRISTICADNARRHLSGSDARPRTWISPRDSPPAMSGPGWSPDRTAPPECIWTNSGPQRNIMRVKGLDGHYASPDRRSISARAARVRPLRQNIAHARTRSSEWTAPPRQEEPRPARSQPRPARSPSAPPPSTWGPGCIYRCGARVRDYYTSEKGTIVVRDVMSTDDNASIAWDGDGTGVTGVHKVNLSRLEPVVPLPKPTRRTPGGLARRASYACATPAELRGQAAQRVSRPPKCQTYPSFNRSRSFRLNPAPDTDEFSTGNGAGDMKESDSEMQFSPRHSFNESWSVSRPPRRSSSESSRQDTGSLLNDLLQRENDQSSDAADNVNQWVSDLPNLESSHSRDNNSISTSTAFSSGSEDEMKSFEACSSNFESPCAPPRRQLSGSCRFEAGARSKPTHRRKQSGPLPRQPVRLSTLSPVDERLGPIDSRTPTSPTIPLSPGTEVEMASLCSSSESSTPRGSFSEGNRVTHLMNGYIGVVTAVYRHIPHCYVKWDHTEAEEDVNSRDIRLVELPEALAVKRNDPTEPRSDASSDTHRQSSTSTTSTGSREPMRVGGPVEVKRDGKWLQAKFRGEDALGRPMYASVEYLHRPGVVCNVRRDRIFRTQKKPT